jgi:hypothetical protein
VWVWLTNTSQNETKYAYSKLIRLRFTSLRQNDATGGEDREWKMAGNLRLMRRWENIQHSTPNIQLPRGRKSGLDIRLLYVRRDKESRHTKKATDQPFHFPNRSIWGGGVRFFNFARSSCRRDWRTLPSGVSSDSSRFDRICLARSKISFGTPASRAT